MKPHRFLYGAKNRLGTKVLSFESIEEFKKRGGKIKKEKKMTSLSDYLTDQGLTDQQVQVAHGVSRGYSNKEIAERLKIKEQTVKFHLTNVYKKLGLASRAQLIIMCLPYIVFQAPYEEPTNG